MVEASENATSLLEDLFDRSLVVERLNGPQIEAWASGLYAVFDEDVSAKAFLTHCAASEAPAGVLLCLAIAELSEGLEPDVARLAKQLAPVAPAVDTSDIGSSELTSAWRVEAPFGRSIVLGFDRPSGLPTDRTRDEFAEGAEYEHSILVEIDRDGHIEDLQLSGEPEALLTEAADADAKVKVERIDPIAAAHQIADAWPPPGVSGPTGPGVATNQQFVRRRIHRATGRSLPPLDGVDCEVDIARGLTAAEFREANRAAHSTLSAAMRDLPERSSLGEPTMIEQTWVDLVRGDIADVSHRERQALLWLEWADWLGAGIGMLRAAPDAVVSGAVLVDYVNRCPEVSSSIEREDRDYAEWAFEVALDVLTDAGAIVEGRLTEGGQRAIRRALVFAWADE